MYIDGMANLHSCLREIDNKCLMRDYKSNADTIIH